MNQQLTPAARAATLVAIDVWAGAALAKLEQNPVHVFERDVGYSVSFDVYHTKLKSILICWLNRSYADPFHPEIRKPLQWGEWELTLSVDPGRRPEYGRFGMLDGGRPKRLDIQGFSSSGRIDHAVEWDTVDELMTELLRNVAVTFDQAWFLFGTGWAPAGLYRSKVTATTLRPGAEDVQEVPRC